jgi:hypothetical protein
VRGRRGLFIFKDVFAPSRHPSLSGGFCSSKGVVETCHVPWVCRAVKWVVSCYSVSQRVLSITNSSNLEAHLVIRQLRTKTFALQKSNTKFGTVGTRVMKLANVLKLDLYSRPSSPRIWERDSQSSNEVIHCWWAPQRFPACFANFHLRDCHSAISIQKHLTHTGSKIFEDEHMQGKWMKQLWIR